MQRTAAGEGRRGEVGELIRRDAGGIGLNLRVGRGRAGGQWSLPPVSPARAMPIKPRTRPPWKPLRAFFASCASRSTQLARRRAS